MIDPNYDSAERARERLEHYGENAESEIGCRQIQLVVLMQIVEQLERIHTVLLKGLLK